MFTSREGDDHLCGDCMQRPPAFGRARAAGVYCGALMAMIHQLKYRACLALIDPLAMLLREAFHCHWNPAAIEVVLPVPLHVRRLRKRGFNQAQLIVDAWARADREEDRSGPCFPKGRRVIIRSRATPPQTGLGKPERRHNIGRAFTVTDEGAVAGCRILLVDDVYTTGATADEAARTLMRSGAASVDILTVARTMPRTR
jgi:ComF family protein